MRKTTLLGPWVRRFLLEHLVVDRNLARSEKVAERRGANDPFPTDELSTMTQNPNSVGKPPGDFDLPRRRIRG